MREKSKKRFQKSKKNPKFLNRFFTFFFKNFKIWDHPTPPFVRPGPTFEFFRILCFFYKTFLFLFQKRFFMFLKNVFIFYFFNVFKNVIKMFLILYSLKRFYYVFTTFLFLFFKHVFKNVFQAFSKHHKNAWKQN